MVWQVPGVVQPIHPHTLSSKCWRTLPRPNMSLTGSITAKATLLLKESLGLYIQAVIHLLFCAYRKWTSELPNWQRRYWFWQHLFVALMPSVQGKLSASSWHWACQCACWSEIIAADASHALGENHRNTDTIYVHALLLALQKKRRFFLKSSCPRKKLYACQGFFCGAPSKDSIGKQLFLARLSVLYAWVFFFPCFFRCLFLKFLK